MNLTIQHYGHGDVSSESGFSVASFMVYKSI